MLRKARAYLVHALLHYSYFYCKHRHGNGKHRTNEPREHFFTFFLLEFFLFEYKPPREDKHGHGRERYKRSSVEVFLLLP